MLPPEPGLRLGSFGTQKNLTFDIEVGRDSEHRKVLLKPYFSGNGESTAKW